MRVPDDIIEEIRRARAAGETHQLGRAFAVHEDDAIGADPIGLAVTAIDADQAAQMGPGVFLVITESDGDETVLVLDEAAKAQLQEQLERHAHLVGLHRAMAIENAEKAQAPAAIAQPFETTQRWPTTWRRRRIDRR